MRAWILFVVLLTVSARGQERTPQAIFAAALSNIVEVITPAEEAAPRTFTTRLQFSKAEGIPERFADSTVELAVQAPDRVLITAKAGGEVYGVGRNRQQLWAHVPAKRFAVVGEPGQARFLSTPHRRDTTTLDPLKLPVPREQVALLPFLMQIGAKPSEKVHNEQCDVLQVRPQPEALKVWALPRGTFTLWVRRG